MRVHHLNCISSCPLGGHLMDGRTPGLLTRGKLCCHCLAVETDEGIVLVDTGFGLAEVWVYQGVLVAIIWEMRHVL